MWRSRGGRAELVWSSRGAPRGAHVELIWSKRGAHRALTGSSRGARVKLTRSPCAAHVELARSMWTFSRGARTRSSRVELSRVAPRGAHLELS
eukprot:7686507-Alexandrium_andersonii.AAC.1